MKRVWCNNEILAWNKERRALFPHIDAISILYRMNITHLCRDWNKRNSEIQQQYLIVWVHFCVVATFISLSEIYTMI